MAKKITVLTGSPHKNGTSSQLADAFVNGVSKTNDLYRFDAGLNASKIDFLKIDENEMTIHDDDIISKEVMPRILDAGVLVLCTSLYYYGINAELKTVIDRFYEYNHELKDGKDVYVLISGYSSGNKDSEFYHSLVEYFDQLCKYMRWNIKGEVLASNSWNNNELNKHIAEAADLGKSIN
ncbi:flavodoxin family protein [Lactobacillus halodurans]|uniref:Flavodoxin family protein n=1 Tax=Companilactobacillus halodurans TaxID=2584183 RepID=A0A5P0ZPG3_9LACO|nr:NAD(P)H-dependent oxidoreductase [Companilactobacillus halodurans]MQS76092.1 flavodoxin family protein [Companilactobacillus halodurans]